MINLVKAVALPVFPCTSMAITENLPRINLTDNENLSSHITVKAGLKYHQGPVSQ